ncbi:MAG TPA: condensation domain-containing protein [Bryobacteraceae bacterium]|nr:condensation domain-containing protein [Bryobacteraceae bacterium]
MTQPGTISQARRLLLEKFRRGELQVSGGAVAPLIPRHSIAQAPLPPGLQQVWLQDQTAGGAPVNNESYTIHKRGPLDPAILERCFNEIVRRHEIWRSAFPVCDGEIVQRIDSNVRVPLPLVDLSCLPAVEREAESARIAAEDARRPFDLEAAPLIRVRLVRWAEDYHRIYLTAHRLVFDCASIDQVLMGELAALYGAYSAGQPSPLPEPVLQYQDYAAWIQRQLASGVYAAQMEYWRQCLSQDLPLFEVASGRPRPAKPSWRSEMETCTLPARLTGGLKELAGAEGATLYMILLAAFQALLHRYSGQDEIAVGGKTNTRTRPEFESLIGSFVNSIVSRSHMSAELSFREFLAQVKGSVLGALAHGDIPFEEVVRELAPEHGSSRHPLFQVLFSMRAPFGNFPDGWDLTDMEAHSGASSFDVFAEFFEQPQGLVGRFVYNTDLFDRATILWLQGNFQVLLQEVVANPDQTLSQIPWLNGSELQAALAAVVRPAPASPPPQREFVAPQNQIEERLTAVWQDVLSVVPISVTDNYFDLGGDSWLALRLFSEIKFCFGLELPLATLFHAPTIRTMAEIIRDSGVRAAAPIVPIQPNGAKPAIFCIGPVNGEVILFRKLALELGEDQPLYGLQPFSLVDRLSTVESLAASYIAHLEQWGKSGPFCLLGYSFGGLVAVEMARQLVHSGAEAPLVVLIDAGYLAGCKAQEPWRDRIRRYRYHLNEIVHGSAGFRHLGHRMRSLYFRVMHRASTSLGVEGPHLASDIGGRQLLAAETYRAKPYAGPVWLFQAEIRPEFFADPKMGWGKILSNLRIEAVPGDHGTINTGLNLKILARKLVAALERP